LTRKEIGAVLGTDGLRLGLLVMHAELEAVICSGPPRGNQHTYALLDERAPRARRLDGEEALAELTLRYFTGHGPATAKDLAAWASLTVTDVTRGLDAVADRLERTEVDGRVYWYAEPPPRRAAPPAAYLLQTYDEYVMGYGETRGDRLLFAPPVLDGPDLVGRWKRTIGRDGVTVEATLDRPVDEARLRAAAQRYGRYLGLPVTLRTATAAASP
jgi:Winged helix DNA-binding domain